MNFKPVNRIVLVMVDDDEDDCLLVEAALHEANLKCDFFCVENGMEMMDYLNQRGRFENSGNAPRPDIVLLDLNLPRMSGLQVLEVIKTDQRFRAIPVIILTTSREEEDIESCYDMGANTYIIKEASFAGLVSAIKVVREYWLETVTLPPKGELGRSKK